MHASLTPCLLLALSIHALACGLTVQLFAAQGETLADKELGRDLVEHLRVMDHAMAAGCKTERKVLTTEITKQPVGVKYKKRKAVAGTWEERWVIERCGKQVAYDVTFEIAPDGTLFSFGLGKELEAEAEAPVPAEGEIPMAFELKSAAFNQGGDIPKKHTCDGADVSPALSWGEPPAKTAALALIADDPDAPVGTWVHWVAYNLPGTARELAESVAKQEKLEDGMLQGRNDFRRIGYGGPCPPAGPAHRYYFKLYALDGPLSLKAGATKAEVEKAMKGHVLGQAELMGRYKR